MNIVLQQEGQVVRIPGWVCDLSSFRRWAKSDDYPRRGWYAHLNGDLWVDAANERAGHNLVKFAILTAIMNAFEADRAGMVLSGGMLLTNVDAALATDPDGMFLSYESLHAGRVRLAEGNDSQEVEGGPDMVLEVTSPTSRHRDVDVLRDLYWLAGVREYWLVDTGPRGHDLDFSILRHGTKGYAAARRQPGGWVSSSVFGKSFRLSRQETTRPDFRRTRSTSGSGPRREALPRS